MECGSEKRQDFNKEGALEVTPRIGVHRNTHHRHSQRGRGSTQFIRLLGVRQVVILVLLDVDTGLLPQEASKAGSAVHLCYPLQRDRGACQELEALSAWRLEPISTVVLRLIARLVTHVFCSRTKFDQMSPPSLAIRLAKTVRHTWHLGFTSFGGPPVHFGILYRRFVERQGWVSQQTVSSSFFPNWQACLLTA